MFHLSRRTEMTWSARITHLSSHIKKACVALTMYLNSHERIAGPRRWEYIERGYKPESYLGGWQLTNWGHHTTRFLRMRLLYNHLHVYIINKGVYIFTKYLGSERVKYWSWDETCYKKIKKKKGRNKNREKMLACVGGTLIYVEVGGGGLFDQMMDNFRW